MGSTAEASYTEEREVFVLRSNGGGPSTGKPRGTTNGYTMSEAATAQRQAGAFKPTHGIYGRSQALRSYRDERVDELMAKAQSMMTWLAPSDVPVLRRWCELEVLARSAFRHLAENGIVNDRGVPRRLLGEYTRIANVQLAYERQMGMTPAARAALGLTVARIAAVGDPGANPATTVEEVAALEARLLERIGGSTTVDENDGDGD